MALNVISNFAANVAHRNLTMSDTSATDSLTKLSSGKRVNSAKDDAASLAIGSRLRAEVAAMRTANVNTRQAGSMLQIADGAMATVSDILVRMKELAVQASSGQFSSIERGVLDSEYQALLSEITRVADDTEFNGTQLIAGGATTSSNILDSSTVTNYALDSASGFTSFTFDNSVTDGAYEITFDAATNVLTVTDLTGGSTAESQTIDPTAIAAQDDGETTKVRFDDIGLSIKLNNNFSDSDITTTASAAFAATTGTLDLAAGAVTIDSLDLKSTTGITDLGTAATVQLDLTTGTDGTDSTVTLQVSGGGNDFTATGVDLSSAGTTTVALTRDGTDSDGDTVVDTLTLSIDITGGADGSSDEDGSFDLGNLNNIAYADQTGDATKTSFTFKVGTGNQTYDSLTFEVKASSASALSLNGTDITTASNAETASTSVSDAIDTLNQNRSDIGAAQNRLTFASNNLATAIENAEAARSTLLDLDVAQEISTFTSKQILVQTGVAMLAQANQLPQNLLRLFQ